MPSPFPGMDPYLEGSLWPDFHQALASHIRAELMRQIRPPYVALLAVSVIEDTFPEGDIGVMYPDVEVLQRPSQVSEPEMEIVDETDLTPATLSIPALIPPEVKNVSIEIFDREDNQLITSIEILSPVNKRRPGLEPYQKKRQRLLRAGIHLLEIDLLRRGERLVSHSSLPESDYLIALTRRYSGRTDLWPFSVRDKLPCVPVPLRDPDPDARLDFGKLLNTVYDEAVYDRVINYRQAPPPPPFSAETEAWWREHRLSDRS